LRPPLARLVIGDGHGPDVGDGPGSTVGRLAATVERLRAQVREAHAAADGRALVELAKGVLVERLRCSPTDAAAQLAALTDQTGLSQLELAADLVNQAARDRVAELADEFLAQDRDRREAESVERAAAVRLRTAESGALAASDTQRVAEFLLEHALAPLGATAVAIWSAGVDASLSLVGVAGLPAEEARRWRYVPPGVATPARCALAQRTASWIEDLGGAGLPSIGHHHLPRGGRVAVPAGVAGRILGVLEICWPRPLDPQPPQIVKQVEALAELCARTLEADPGPPGGAGVEGAPSLSEAVELAEGLLDPALVLRPHLDDRGELVDFRIHHLNGRFVDLAGRPRGAVSGALLLEAYPTAAGHGMLFDKIEHVYATGESFRAERMQLPALVGQVPLTVLAAVGISRVGRTVLLVWRVHDEAARLANLLQHAQRLGRVGGFEENTLTGGITWNSQLFALYGLEPGADPVPLADLAGHAHVDDTDAVRGFLRSVLDQHRAGSTSFRLLRPDGVVRHLRVVAEPELDDAGHLLAVRGAYQDISAQHWTEVALTATQDKLSHSELQVAAQNRLALQLQHAIMPPAEPSIDAFGLHIAVRYRPAEHDHFVGGDWYDAVVLPSKQVFVSVGDIAGHGIKGATGMVVLRNALRGLAATGAGPSQMLAWLNLVAHHLAGHIFATAVCALYDPNTRTLRWARAGHPPPVLVRGQDASTLPDLRGIMLGALAETDYEEDQVQLELGDTLLLYTDGLVERRGEPLDECVERLRRAAAHPDPSLDDRLDRLLATSDIDDDTCLLGLEVR
jgi:PAS domain-containing protein